MTSVDGGTQVECRYFLESHSQELPTVASDSGIGSNLDDSDVTNIDYPEPWIALVDENGEVTYLEGTGPS